MRQAPKRLRARVGHPHLDQVGLERVRERLERAVLLPLTREALYQKVARAVMPGGVNVLPRGVLLTGPPGTGKTWSMRALAGEAGLPVVALPCEALLGVELPPAGAIR